MEFKPVSKKRSFEKTASGGKTAQRQRHHRKFDADGEFDDPDESKPRPSNKQPANKKVVFDDDGNTLDDDSSQAHALQAARQAGSKKRGSDVDTKWFQTYSAYNTHDSEVLDMKDSELAELTNTSRSAFESLLAELQKQNPSDAKWLQTALHKGTSKDRANAGALLVQSNPLANLGALETLITLAKVSNKTSAGAVDIITELFVSALLPPSRKLHNLQLRGADWKALRKNTELDAEVRQRVLAYWHFEQELKEQYFEFLRNVQAAIQGNQDAQKNQAIICAARLLTFSPEKEQMLLSMLVNKLGDPSNKVASKALHHLSEVAYKHPAMCEVITKETEKLLFRHNITEHAQHFALCFLSTVAPRGNAAVCTRLVQICFSFFKVVVQKGAVNSKTMQAILRCLKRAIVDASGGQVSADGGDLLTKDIQDTMYRLVHLADIHITLQTLALLLQVMTVRSGNYDRFYNALYRKMLDLNLVNVGPKAAAQFLHIVHRAMHMDANVPRAQAFVKRLLQVAFYLPAHITCGCLIVVNKLLKSRPEIGWSTERPAAVGILAVEQEPKDGGNALAVEDDDDDGEEHYEDARDEADDSPADAEDADESETKAEDAVEKQPAGGSWHHAKVGSDDVASGKRKASAMSATKYNPYHRNPAYAGAEFALKTELLQLARHYHPTVQVFAQNIIAAKPIAFYGDPLRDFCLTQFLERFAFRNPKKLDDRKTSDSLAQTVHHKNYTAHGGRGQPVQNLTQSNCTEDERFIFQYLEEKREKRSAIRKSLGKKSGDDDGDSDGSVDDDEFEQYLDGLGGPGGDEDGDEIDYDFMGDLGDELRTDEDGQKPKKDKASKRAQKRAADADETADGDWDEDGDEGEDDDASDSGMGGNDDDDELDSDGGSVSLDGEDDEDGSDLFEASDDDEDDNDPEVDSEDDEPKSKKSKGASGDRAFRKKLDKTEDMSSLFAAADDFSEMLQETGKSKAHGTLGELFNQDKSSEKQLAWEQNRFRDAGGRGGGFGGRGGKQSFGGHKYKGNKNFGRGAGKQKKRK